MEAIINEVPHALKEIFSRVLKVPENQISAQSNTTNTKNWDSLRHVELVVEVEEKFDVSFGTTEVFTLTSVQGFCDMLAKKSPDNPLLQKIAGAQS